MTSSSNLRLEPLTIEDNAALTELWFAAFSEPILRRVFPNTPGVRQWLEDANRHDLLNKPFQRYVKVVDPQTKDDQGRPRIAAYAKWDLSMPEERGRRYPPWHEEMPSELCEEFFLKEEANRRRVMGNQRHYCMCFAGIPGAELHGLTMQIWIRSQHTRTTSGAGRAQCLSNGAATWPMRKA